MAKSTASESCPGVPLYSSMPFSRSGLHKPSGSLDNDVQALSSSPSSTSSAPPMPLVGNAELRGNAADSPLPIDEAEPRSNLLGAIGGFLQSTSLNRPPEQSPSPSEIPILPVISTGILSSDYALNFVFKEFETIADKKMAAILNMKVESEVDLPNLIGFGVDPAFDKVIHSLALLATTQQKPVIDAVMRWRKSKIEPLDQSLIKRVSESLPLSRTREVPSVLKERQSLASVYILCRALIEIVKGFTSDILPDDLGENLEEIVFNQLKRPDPDAIKRSKNRTASMDLFAELIGELSNIRFASVSDRFIAELEKYKSQTIMKERQSHMEMLVRGMRFLKIKIYPVDALEETADFLFSCASFFKNAHGTKVKHAYATLFVQLLLPTAEVTVAEVNFPAWAKAVDLMYPRAQRMTLKPRHIMTGYPLLTTLLCVSRKEFFVSNWLSVVDSCYQKFNKDRHIRQLALGCVSRLTWTYLFRCSESTLSTFKKLDSIIKTIFPPSRRAVYPAETPLDHFILITYFALMKDVDSAMEKIIYYLLKADSTGTTVHWEFINPERVIVALSAFRLMLADLERNIAKPPFPACPDMSDSGIQVSSSADVFSRPIRAVKADVMERVEEIISKTLLSLDETFGRLLVLDEKNIIQRPAGGSSSATTLGTNYSVPIFSNSVGIPSPSDNSLQTMHQYPTFYVSYSKDRQAYFDVIKSILESMPRLMPAGIPLPRLVEMLCRYTVHVDPELIQSASQALLRIAAQIDSQTVVTGYSRFVYHIEDKHCDIMTSLAHGPLTGSNHHSNGGVMKLYVDLLVIWVGQIDLAPLKDLERETSPSRTADANLDMQRLLSMIEETEANGLLFLCSQALTVRRSSIQVIRLAMELENKLNALLQNESKEGTGNNAAHATLVAELNGLMSKQRNYRRVYEMMESAGQDFIKFDEGNSTLFGTQISTETQTRLQQHQKRATPLVLIHIAESNLPIDLAIWDIIYPELFKKCFRHFPETVALCRQNICARLVQIQPSILAAIESIKAGTTGTLSMAKSNNANHRATSPETIEQWKIYLIFVCATATVGENRVSTKPWANNSRKGAGAADKIAMPKDLFKMVLQFLTCEHRQIREGAIQGLGNVNTETYKTLMTELQSHVRVILDDGKQRSNQKPYQNKRSKKNDRLRLSLMHVLKLTAECLHEQKYLEDKDLMTIITSYIKETKSFLADAEVQVEWEYHKLRTYLCGLVEKLYKNIMRLDDLPSIMSFETRLSLYKMFEEWCGYGMYANVARTREATMMRDVLDQCKDARERTSMTQLMEEERQALEAASLSAMAMLCRGPLYAFLGQKKARQAVIQFDMLNVLRWIDAVFESGEPRYHKIARHALESILEYNQDQTLLLDDIIEQCYAGNPKLEFTQSYFLALADIITREEEYPCHIHQIMSLAIFKAGDAKKSIRKAAIHLLRVVEERVFADSCAKEYEIGITSSLPAIYKHTQSLLSARLALDHPEQTFSFSILSEITQRFEHISPNSQREVLSYMLPWLRKVDLSVGPQDMELSASAFLVLSNLFYTTIKFGDVYVKEIAALWNQLVDHGRNVRAIIMFLLDMGLEKRNPWFLVHAKRVLVCLGRTAAFSHVVEEVIAEITPRSMVPQLKEVSSRHADAFQLLFVADIEKVLAPYAKRPVFARGQLAMVYLVDLAIESGADLAPHLPLLLHSIFVHLDHLTSIVCDQSRCLLINLIHSIVIRQCPDSESTHEPTELIKWLSSKEGKRLWAYENITPTNRKLQSTNELKELIQKVVSVFSRQDMDLRQKWGETALKWATCCSVRHIACRSFQCFRALMPAFNQHMLADMLARLSNTIADKSDEIRGFALEIVLTLTDVARAMKRDQAEQFPQLFWAAVACLYGPYESEHSEALQLLEVVLDKYGFSYELAESFPKDWSSEFDGLQPLLLKGLQFSSAEEKTFAILSRLMLDDNAQLVDPSNTRLLYLLLGCLPRLLHGLEEKDGSNKDCEETETIPPSPSPLLLASNLAQLCERYALLDTQRALATYPKQKAKFQEEYLKQILTTISDVYLAEYGQQALEYSILLVKNKLPYYRDKALMLVENLLPYAAVNTTADPAGRRAVLSEAALEPLLRLVQTEYVDKALSILNLGMIVTTTHDTQPLREDSLLTVNDPIDAAQVTRHNVHAVVFECSSITNETPIEHNIQFSIEDFSGVTGEEEEPVLPVGRARSFAGLDVGGNAVPGDGLYHGEGLMNTLKDLDDFFNEDVETLTQSSSRTLLHANQPGMEESNEESGNEEST